jgi:hypothetical protein
MSRLGSCLHRGLVASSLSTWDSSISDRVIINIIIIISSSSQQQRYSSNFKFQRHTNLYSVVACVGVVRRLTEEA